MSKWPNCLAAIAAARAAFHKTAVVMFANTTGKHFTKESFTSFARDYLGADIIFWACTSPWLKQPVHR